MTIAGKDSDRWPSTRILRLIQEYEFLTDMADEPISTTPKPFIFVLMPFDASFDDIYKFGIKGAAEDAGAYAERIDEQIFSEGILDRVFNQINKSDVIVADMTGRNPNVFYEVGYAHALGKIVLLLTQKADDIPFDLKHHQHIVYGGSIEVLKSQLISRISWAINESKRTRIATINSFEVTFDDIAVSSGDSGSELPTFSLPNTGLPRFFKVVVRNVSFEITEQVDYIYLFTAEDSKLEISASTGSLTFEIDSSRSHSSDEDEGFGKQYALPNKLPALPPGTLQAFSFGVANDRHRQGSAGPVAEQILRLQLHTSHQRYRYDFKATK